MTTAAEARLLARVNAHYANGGHRTYFTSDLNDVATVGGDAAAAAAAAAASLVTAQALTGGSTGIGADTMDVPRNADLGSAAFASINSIRGIFFVNGDSTYQMLPEDCGKIIVATSGTRTWTLPAASSLPEGWFVQVKNRSGNNLTIARSGADTINAAATSLVIVTGDGVTGGATTISLTSATTFESF